MFFLRDSFGKENRGMTSRFLERRRFNVANTNKRHVLAGLPKMAVTFQFPQHALVLLYMSKRHRVESLFYSQSQNPLRTWDIHIRHFGLERECVCDTDQELKAKPRMNFGCRISDIGCRMSDFRSNST